MNGDWLQQYLDYYGSAYGAGPSEVNPYQTYYGTADFGDLSGAGWTGAGFTGHEDLSGELLDQGILGAYGYQGMSPDIMQALGNVFDLGTLDYLPTSSFGAGQSGNIDLLALDPGMSVADVSGVPFGPTAGGTNVDLFFAGANNPFYNMQNLLGFTDIFDPGSIASTLTTLSGIDPEEGIRAGEIKALTPEMLEKTTSAYYSPLEEAERGTLVDKLSKARGKIGTGGFAGSVGREAGLSGAEKLYRGGYQDILSDIMKLRGGATENVLDTVYGWQELMSEQ